MPRPPVLAWKSHCRQHQIHTDQFDNCITAAYPTHTLAQKNAETVSQKQPRGIIYTLTRRHWMDAARFNVLFDTK